MGGRKFQYIGDTELELGEGTMRGSSPTISSEAESITASGNVATFASQLTVLPLSPSANVCLADPSYPSPLAAFTTCLQETETFSVQRIVDMRYVLITRSASVHWSYG